MLKAVRVLAGLAAAALMGLTPGVSLADTPVGIYQTGDGLEEFEVSLCGQDDKFLCVKLLALHGKAQSKRGNKLVGTYVVDHAKPAGTNVWKGKMTIDDKTADSTLTLKQGVSLDVSACYLVVMCASISLPAQK